MSKLRLAFYGDDFTGSVDVLLQLTRAGWRSRLLLGLPSAAELARAAEGVDAVGIAGVARSLPTADIEAEVLPAFRALASLGPQIVQYKACSTADSSPTVGSIGRVIEVARQVFGPASIPVLFAQPDFGRYTSFGHHFAAEGGTVYRLDRQPTMSKHPVTPMHESDLARHLSAQTGLPIGGLHFTDYTDNAAIAAALDASSDAATVLDALSDAHVDLIAEALGGASAQAEAAAGASPRFVIGSGGLSAGIGRALSANGREAGAAGAAPHPLNPVGPVLAVSGSRSPQTARQIEDARRSGWAIVTLPLAGDALANEVRDTVIAELAAGRSVVLCTDEQTIAGDAAQIVTTIAHQLATVVEAALRAGATRRVIVCGGDTSSHIVRLLGADALSLAANPVGNVVLCRAESAEPWLDGAELLLKGGQVGPADLFELVRTLTD